jgi:acyl-CoA synthetase (NDP forming)
VAADLCVENGLELAPLSADLIARIDRILPPYWSRSNPVDLVGEADLTVPLRVMEEMMRWDGCDAYIHMGVMGRRIMVQWLAESATAVDPSQNKALIKERLQKVVDYEKFFLESMVRLMEKYGKPILGVYLLTDEKSRTITDVEGSPFKGVVYLTPEQAVKALAKMHAYWQWLEREGIPAGERGRLPAA